MSASPPQWRKMAIRKVVIDDIDLEYLKVFMRDDHARFSSLDDMWEIIDNVLTQVVKED